jgi:hypothetical protein
MSLDWKNFLLLLLLMMLRVMMLRLLRVETCVNSLAMKDDKAWLLHFFKEPMSQVYWANLYGILNCSQLDAQKSSRPASVVANLLVIWQNIS